MGRMARKINRHRKWVTKPQPQAVDMDAVYGSIPCPFCKTIINITARDVHNSAKTTGDNISDVKHVGLVCCNCGSTAKMDTNTGEVEFFKNPHATVIVAEDGTIEVDYEIVRAEVADESDDILLESEALDAIQVGVDHE